MHHRIRTRHSLGDGDARRLTLARSIWLPNFGLIAIKINRSRVFNRIVIETRVVLYLGEVNASGDEAKTV